MDWVQISETLFCPLSDSSSILLPASSLCVGPTKRWEERAPPRRLHPPTVFSLYLIISMSRWENRWGWPWRRHSGFISVDRAAYWVSNSVRFKWVEAWRGRRVVPEHTGREITYESTSKHELPAFLCPSSCVFVAPNRANGTWAWGHVLIRIALEIPHQEIPLVGINAVMWSSEVRWTYGAPRPRRPAVTSIWSLTGWNNSAGSSRQRVRKRWTVKHANVSMHNTHGASSPTRVGIGRNWRNFSRELRGWGVEERRHDHA